MQRYPAIFKILYPVTAEIVLARNVANVDKIEEYVKKLAGTQPYAGVSRERYDAIKKWLLSNLRNYLISDAEAKKVDPKMIDFFQDKGPQWLLDALKKGQEVWMVGLEKPLRDKIQHALDWMKSDAAPERLDRLTVPEALKQADAWTQALLKKKDLEITEGGEKTIKQYPDGYSWREMASEAALGREGKLMGHCVGGYWKNVASGEVSIWSLRDPNNQPHCTVELHPGAQFVRQIKGKQNASVVKKYHGYVKDLLNDKLAGWEVDSSELGNAGMFYLEKKVRDVDDVRKDPELAHGLVRKYLNNHRLDTAYINMATAKGVAVHDKGIQLHPGDLDLLMELLGVMPDIQSSKLEELKELLEQHYDVDFSVKDSDYQVMELFDYLEEKHPKTFAKLMTDIDKISGDTEDEFTRSWAGRWLDANSGELEPVYDAVVNAISDGYQSGTSLSAYKYVLSILDRLEWDDGSIVSANEDGTFILMIGWPTLTESGDRIELTSDVFGSRREGFDNEFDEESAKSRFHEMLQESNYAVD